MLSLLLAAACPTGGDVSGGGITGIVVIAGVMGLCFALYNVHQVRKIEMMPVIDRDAIMKMPQGEEKGSYMVAYISAIIRRGANAFLFSEYKYIFVFMIMFTIVIVLVIGGAHNWYSGLFTAIAFNIGAMTSMTCGFLGMQIAVYSNGRTCMHARDSYGAAFSTSFKAGSVMGFTLVSLGVLILYILINFFRLYYSTVTDDQESTELMFESVAGYGLGGSSVALFARVGGGIYTKAADVGADLVGKTELDIPEDDPRNPATIADNVGDNVGDVAGMGADLFGSFAESTCAAMVISAQSPDLYCHWSTLTFPILIVSSGIFVCIISSFFATHVTLVSRQDLIEPTLKQQIMVSTILMTPVIFALTWNYLPYPETFSVSGLNGVKNYYIFFCTFCGLWSGLIIGYITEYFTSHSHGPVRELADACETTATNIIYGLALGYKSVIIPICSLAVTIYVSYDLAGMYGISFGALGILSTMCIGLTIDAYGPICDNAGGIAEMSQLGHEVRDITDALDAAGNTTAAIGKGFAIGSAALVSLALFGAFVVTTGMNTIGVDILKPFQFAGLLVGAMLPYWFFSLTMKSVGWAAKQMVTEIRLQWQDPAIADGSKPPDYERCISISAKSSLKEMIAPGALVMLTPLVVGFVFGVKALCGVLAGALVSGVQLAISASNTGGAWDNAKKYIEGGNIPGQKKGGEFHKAAVVGDTVGDPMKDTSGPSLNILIKLMAIISLVFARSFPNYADGGYLEQLFHV